MQAIPAVVPVLSKIQVNSKVESKSQRHGYAVNVGDGCQRSKLIQKLKANHNTPHITIPQSMVVKDPS